LKTISTEHEPGLTLTAAPPQTSKQLIRTIGQTIKSVARIGALAVSAIVLVPICHVIELFWKVRITPLNCSGLGHLAGNTHIYVTKRTQVGREPRTSRIFFGSDPCNQQLFDMWKRILPVLDYRPLYAFYQYAEPILSKLPAFQPLPHNNIEEYKDQHELVAKGGKILTFSREEEDRGRQLLEEMGMRRDDWFVCFQARRPDYHIMREGADNKNHRNCRIDSYLKAAKYITELGGFALRVGHYSKPLEDLDNPKIIDYSWNHRTDFGDIYLLGSCRFFLASSTGTISVPSLFQVPFACANLIPLPVNPNANGLFAPKLLREKSTGRLIHFREMVNYLGGPEAIVANNPSDIYHLYENEIYSLVDNTEDEILDLTLDMLDRIAGREPDEEVRRLQLRFKEIYFGPSTDLIDYSPDISGRFAVKYRDLLED
jgi:putative glycosyltransferase (TIGR04372 family)